MPNQPLFAGLVIDELGHPAESSFIGSEPCYVVDDAGFRRHIPAEQIDRAVLAQMAEMMKGSEEFLSEQTAKMIGQEISSPRPSGNQQKLTSNSITHAVASRKIYYLGMMISAVINYHGEVVRGTVASAGGDEGDGNKNNNTSGLNIGKYRKHFTLSLFFIIRIFQTS
jgi:hypothetical protein